MHSNFRSFAFDEPFANGNFRHIPARALAAAAVLIVVRYDSELSGLMLALAAGFALSLQSADSLFLTGAYGFSALLGCLFCQFGTPATAGAFTLSFALFNVAFGADASYFAEAAIGCGAVAVLPRVLSEKIRSFFHDGADITPDGSLRQSLVMRLRFASGAMSCISESVNEVRERINDINERDSQASRADFSPEEYRTREIINEKQRNTPCGGGSILFHFRHACRFGNGI